MENTLLLIIFLVWGQQINVLLLFSVLLALPEPRCPLLFLLRHQNFNGRIWNSCGCIKQEGGFISFLVLGGTC